MQFGLICRYALDQLRKPGTYVVAVVVGTLINGYGHLLVPYLRGEPRVLEAFSASWQAYPELMTCSVLLGYVFPFCVGIYASVATRYRNRIHEARAEFPDRKPDPVFRARPDGVITVAGARTDDMLRRHNVARAQELLGEELWREMLEASTRGESLPRTTAVRLEQLGEWFLVRQSTTADGSLNVYLTHTDDPPH